MAFNTSKDFRSLMFYQVYLRNHNKSGTFLELLSDLNRIKSLGTDVLYLLPIHPVGQVGKKGELGSIYSIRDYRAINPEYGTLHDFKELIKETHKLGMKLMIDIVFHHTSHDAVLLKEHPEYYFYRNGKNVNKVGDWSDIIDLDFNNKDLWTELIDILVYYAEIGVDGYRCDVAPLIPIEFWIEARAEVAKIKKDFIWLSESVHPSFIKYIRDHGFIAHSDCEVYQAFDILYDYDIHHEYLGYIKGEVSLSEYVRAISRQETTYPDNYVKLRNLENHDQPRIASLVKDIDTLKQLTAFIFFLKGATMIYAGEEALNTKQPSLFDIDKVDWSSYEKKNIDELIIKLSSLKKDPIMSYGNFNINSIDEAVVMSYEDSTRIRYGIMNFGKESVTVKIDVRSDEYLNLIDNSRVVVKNGEVIIDNKSIIFDYIK